MININRKDVLRSTIVPPDWYTVKVKGVTKKPATSDGSTNYFFSIEIAEGENAEIPTKDFLVNEKGVFSSGLNFFVACGFPRTELEKLRKGEATTVQLDENACVGKVIKAFVANTKWENRVSNECTDFLPLDAAIA